MPGRQVSDCARRHVEQQDVSARAVLPLGPVTIEERIGHVRLERALVPRLRRLLVARLVCAFGVDVGCERDPLAVGRPDGIGDSSREMRQRLGLAAVEGQHEQVRVAVATADKCQRPAIWRKDRRAAAGVALRQLPRSSRAEFHQPDLRGPLAARQVAGRHRISGAGPVGRDLNVADRSDAVELLDRERSFLGVGRCGDKKQDDEQWQISGHRSKPSCGAVLRILV